MKRLSTAFILTFGVCWSPSVCSADEYVDSKSPDGKFALHVTRGDKQPFLQTDTVIERATRKVIVDLDKDALFAPEAKLVWAKNSQRFAYVRETKEDPRCFDTRVFQRNGATFDEIKLPDLPPPKLPSQASASEPRQVNIKAIRWPDANSLELNYEIITDNGWRGAENISLKFDGQSSPTIAKNEPEPVSIVDYFLLLPDDALELRPRHWFHNETSVDKKNGYLTGGGDGAQPPFEAALFRYRDGRPLLALCEGELEGDDRVSLEFFEMGSDGKMRKAPRKIFPINDQWVSDEPDKKYKDFRFELPRHGGTVLVRSAKTKKILHRVAWNGEKFVEQK